MYDGDWGQIVLREVNGEIWGAYRHDEGTVRGVVYQGGFYGWWTEVPSREPDGDAGDVQFCLVRNASGQRVIDGSWAYGRAANAEEGWNDDWNLTEVSEAPDPALLARFDDESHFRARPTRGAPPAAGP